MDASLQFCPNESCCARGQIGAGNLSIHGRKRPRYKCHSCGKTFNERKGTMLEGLRTDEEKVGIVVMLLAYGCPLQAIVHAFGLDERTVAAWQRRAGTHCKRVHIDVVQQGKVKSQHIQADEIRAKGRKIIVWIALAMDVTTRLWLAGTVSQHRDRTLIDRLLQHVRACCQVVHGLLVCTDGFAAYPNSIVRAFREKVKKRGGPGRCSLEATSRTLEENAFWMPNYTSNGCRIDKSYLEYSRAVVVQSRSCTMGSNHHSQAETVTRPSSKTSRS
jgi:transposase-like protein